MTSRDFCYWLQGKFELDDVEPPKAFTAKQVAIIKKHLAMVFIHEIDPSYGEDQGKLNEIHNQSPVVSQIPSKPGSTDLPPKLPTAPVFLDQTSSHTIARC